jgi:GTP-binding protein EngB required for normal cell division
MLERISRLADELNLVNLAPQIAACRNLAGASNGVDVAVLGRFKAGKSSFLNHLTGREVLPVGVVPLTAVVTRLRNGPVESGTVRFLRGEVRQVPVGDIGQFVGEKENPDNTKQVAAVEVELPALDALAPLAFVDTPGLGSAFVHNTGAAMKWLPNVGAAVVAVSADAPLSERDLGLLDELRRYTPRIVLLLTKADLLTEAQRGEVLAFVREQMGRRGLAELPVFLYSVKPGFADLKNGFVDRFLLPLRDDHGAAGEEILRHKMRSLAGQVGEYLQVARAAATRASSAREALQARLREERQQWGLLREELHGLSRQ